MEVKLLLYKEKKELDHWLGQEKEWRFLLEQQTELLHSGIHLHVQEILNVIVK